jgi:nucleoside-diphosphate-sugar epimerase
LIRKTSNLNPLSGIRVKICSGDITEIKTLFQAVRGVDVVAHLAAIRGERPVPMNEYWDVNVRGTANLLEACEVEGVSRFIYFSTVGVMGWIKKPPANEEQPLNPIGPYHITKARAERLVREFTYRGLVNGTVLRPGITYGAGDRDGWIFKLAQLLKNERFIWIGRGENRVHLVAVENLLQAFGTVIRNKDSIGETLIICDSTPTTIDRVVRTICDTLNVSPPVWRIPTSLTRALALVAYRAGSVYTDRQPIITPMQVDVMTQDRWYDISKARSLGYSPGVSTATGLRRAVEWMKKRKMI